jgi:hypothetical protein
VFTELTSVPVSMTRLGCWVRPVNYNDEVGMQWFYVIS